MKNILITIIVVIIMVTTVLVGASVLVRKPAPRHIAKHEATTMKRVVWMCLGNGIAWVWCSYLLAWFGREQIAESLSQVAITEIIGVVLVYALKALIENLSKHNRWPDKTKATEQLPENQGQE